MKHLIQYKLYEGFESTILSKTLGYIKDKSDKNSFLNILKNICNTLDYPYSKLNDKYFEYLAFNKALMKADMTGDEPCTATSRQEFPQYAVEGSKCEGGKLKRKWGSRTRDVVCPVCNGTGIAPKTSEIKLLKFWFDKDGKYITTTAVDGVMRKTPKGGSFSKKLSNYKIVGSLTHEEVLKLKTGQYIITEINGRDTICYIFREAGRVFAVQDIHSGTTPSDRSWQKFGRYCWALGGSEYRNARLLEPNNLDDDKVEADPYEWNVGLNVRYSNFRIETSKDVQQEISAAHFAIILDFGKLKKSEYKTKGEIEEEREEAKKGSILDPAMSDEEIKSTNIERYMSTLSGRLDITSDITNCNKLVSRALGYKNALWLLWSNNDIYQEFINLISDYIRLMKSDDTSDKEYYVDNIKSRTNRIFKRGMSKSSEFDSNIASIKKRLREEKKDDEYLQLIEGLEKLSETLYKTLTNFQIDTIEDFEVLTQKISGVRNILKSERYAISRLGNYFIDYLNRGYSDRAYTYYTDRYYTNVDDIIKELPAISRIIERM